MPDPQSLEAVAASLSEAQRRLLRAMRVRGPKKWRAIYRDAKVSFHRGANHQLPFSLARPTLTGFEALTPLGIALKSHLESSK
jgi:hypothetical protein